MDVFLICFIIVTPIFGIICFGIGFWVGARYITGKYLKEQKPPRSKPRPPPPLEEVRIDPREEYMEPDYGYFDMEAQDDSYSTGQRRTEYDMIKIKKPSSTPKDKKKKKPPPELLYGNQ